MSEIGPTRVLLVDDSATVRAVLRRLLGRASDLEVVGEADNGERAIAEALRLRPDVVLMDIEMPVLDGYAATERLMALRPTAILVLTSRANRDQVHTAFEAIRRGALEVLPKPEDAAGWELLATTLPEAVRAARRAHPVAPAGTARPRGAPQASAAKRCATTQAISASSPEKTPATSPALRREPGGGFPPPPPRSYLAIGASTGGPGAVRDLLEALPAELPAAVLLVQHIAAGFEEGLAEWLAGDLGRPVTVARDGETPEAGEMRVAPAGAHLLLGDGGVLHLDSGTPPRRGHRPSADELFLSCARACPRQVAGVLLTGMGSDGAEGLAALREAGGFTLVQDEASSVVFGMPRAALERGAATIALPPRELAHTLERYWRRGLP